MYRSVQVSCRQSQREEKQFLQHVICVGRGLHDLERQGDELRHGVVMHPCLLWLVASKWKELVLPFLGGSYKKLPDELAAAAF